MSIYDNPQLTPREQMLMEHDAEQARLAREHSVTIKQLDIQFLREKNEGAIELKRLEAKWDTWLRLPALIIKLPVFLVLGLAYIVAICRKIEPSKDFWSYLK